MYLGRKRAGSSFDSEEITDKFNKLTGKGIFVDRNKLSKPFPYHHNKKERAHASLK